MDINKYIKSRRQENDFRASHDVSSAWNYKGKIQGAVKKEKQSFWQRLKNSVEFDIKNLKEILTGKKSVLQGIKDRNAETHNDLMENNKIYRDTASVVQGVTDAIKAKVNEKIASNEVLTRLQENISSGIADTKLSNELHHNFNVTKNGVKPKSPLWNRFKDVISGKKGVYETVRDNVKDVRAMDSLVYGTYSGIIKTISELRVAKPSETTYESANANTKTITRIAQMRGLSPKETPAKNTEDNKYAKLDDGQFRVALGTAYENLYRLNGHDNPDSYASDKKKVLDEINLVLEEAKKRFPNAGEIPNKGTLYKDGEVAFMEQQMMPFMKEAAKQDNIFAADVNRFEAWRNNEPAVIANNGTMKVTEEPYHNKARWPEHMSSLDQLKHPFEAGKNTMSAAMLQQQKELVAKLHMK